MFESRIEIPTALVFGPIGWFNVIQLWGITMAGVRQLISSMSDRLEQGIARWNHQGSRKNDFDWQVRFPFISQYLNYIMFGAEGWLWSFLLKIKGWDWMHLVSLCTKTSPNGVASLVLHFPMRQPRFELLKNSLRAVVERRAPMAGIDGFMWMTWMRWECSNLEHFLGGSECLCQHTHTHIFHGKVMAQSLQVERWGQSSFVLLDAEMMWID